MVKTYPNELMISKKNGKSNMFPRKWLNLGHGKLGKVIEKVMERHGISNAQKGTNPD